MLKIKNFESFFFSFSLFFKWTFAYLRSVFIIIDQSTINPHFRRVRFESKFTSHVFQTNRSTDSFFRFLSDFFCFLRSWLLIGWSSRNRVLTLFEIIMYICRRTRAVRGSTAVKRNVASPPKCCRRIFVGQVPIQVPTCLPARLFSLFPEILVTFRVHQRFLLAECPRIIPMWRVEGLSA